MPITTPEMVDICNEWRLKQPDGSYFYGGNIVGFQSNNDYASYKEITFEFFQKYIKDKKQTDIKEITQTFYKIETDVLSAYWKAATNVQRTFLNNNFKLDGTTTKEAIVQLYNLACSEWKPKIKANHPDYFKDYKYFDLKGLMCCDDNKIFTSEQAMNAGFNNNRFIQIRTAFEYESKGFFLDSNYNWEIVTDSNSQLVLLPKKRKK